jgi:hypothetical protein
MVLGGGIEPARAFTQRFLRPPSVEKQEVSIRWHRLLCMVIQSVTAGPHGLTVTRSYRYRRIERERRLNPNLALPKITKSRIPRHPHHVWCRPWHHRKSRLSHPQVWGAMIVPTIVEFVTDPRLLGLSLSPAQEASFAGSTDSP